MNPALLLAAPLLLLPAPPAAQPVLPAADQLGFADLDQRMTVPVTIGDAVTMAETGPYRFVVDTGAERTVIARELAERLRLAPGRGVRVTAMAGSGDVATVVIPRISIGAASGGARVTSQRIEAPAFDGRNLGAAGLVGIDTLQGHALTIDFDRQTMTVALATRRLREEHFGADDIVVRARSLFGQLVVTDATYHGARVRVVLDTGSVVSIGNAALRSLVAKGARGPMTAIRLTSVTGATLQADYATIDALRFGDTGFSNLPVAFADAAPFARLGLEKRPALMLGMDALRLFRRVRIDFANRELRLERPCTPGPACVPGVAR